MNHPEDRRGGLGLPSQRHRPQLKPAGNTIEPVPVKLDRAALTRANPVDEGAQPALLFRADHREEVLADDLVNPGGAHQRQARPVDGLKCPLACQEGDARRNGLDDQPKPRFGGAQGGFFAEQVAPANGALQSRCQTVMIVAALEDILSRAQFEPLHRPRHPGQAQP